MPPPTCRATSATARFWGTVFHAGNQTLTVTFTPADTLDYTNGNASVNLEVNKAVVTVTADNQSRAFGQSESDVHLWLLEFCQWG